MAEQQNILFVLKVPPPYGGGEIEQLYIYQALKEKYSFILFSRKSHNKARQGKLKLSNLLFGFRMIFQVLLACMRQKPHTVFIWLPKDLPAFIRNAILVSLLRLMRIRVVGDLHGMGFGFLPRWQRFYERHINRYAAIRTLSDSISESVRQTGYHHQLCAIDNGIQTPTHLQIKTAEIAEPVQLLYLGAISKAKGFQRVLDCLLQLKEKNIRFSLKVVGEWTSDDFKERAQEFIAANSLTANIRFAGILLGEKKWQAIERSDLLLHFTEWDGQPLTIIEALAAGVLSIATRVGAIPEMIQHNKDGFLVNNSVEAAEIIENLLKEKKTYKRISQAARQTFERRFTLETYINNIERFVGDPNRVTGATISKNR